MEKPKTTSLITPKSINELASIITKYPDAQLFAGGTYIMSRLGYYPNSNPRDIITLANISELTRVLHVDKYVELGAMVTIQQLLNSNTFIFSDALIQAISEIGTSVIRHQITIGGSLCTNGIRFSLPCILASLNAQAEIITGIRRGPSFMAKPTDRWVPVAKLYDTNGNYVFEGRGFISRIRIPAEQNNYQVFKTIGNPMHEPSSTVIMGFTYNIVQGKVISPTFCLVFPKGGFFCSQDFNNILSKIVFPLSTAAMVQLDNEFDRLLTDSCKSMSEVQHERAKRLFINTLYRANASYLGG